MNIIELSKTKLTCTAIQHIEITPLQLKSKFQLSRAYIKYIIQTILEIVKMIELNFFLFSLIHFSSPVNSIEQWQFECEMSGKQVLHNYQYQK